MKHLKKFNEKSETKTEILSDKEFTNFTKNAKSVMSKLKEGGEDEIHAEFLAVWKKIAKAVHSDLDWNVIK